MIEAALAPAPAMAAGPRPRIGFLGTGWIGRHRMEALCRSGVMDAAACADSSHECLAEAQRLAPGAAAATSLDELLGLDLDGVVIATPSALHADQVIRALEHGLAVFCQKPLGRNGAETQKVIAAARAADRLLGVDLCYRHTEAMRQIRNLLSTGALGRVHALDLVFHNAYGPDKPWFYDPRLSGGGCVMDLGIHLVDLALWALDFPEIVQVASALNAGGEPLANRTAMVEDYAVATLHLGNGAVVRLACSWRLHAGCDAVISASFFGTNGGATLRNVNGSFYDFVAEHHQGTSNLTLASPPDEWGGRAAIAWAQQLTVSPRYRPEADRLTDVARALDLIYAACPPAG